MSKARISLIGDSISIHYGPYLQSALKQTATWVGYSDKEMQGALADLDTPTHLNCGNSTRCLEIITQMLKKNEGKIDLMLLNCGQHDIKSDLVTGDKQVPLETYKTNLQQILKLVAQHQIPLVWVRTTPVNDAIHNSLATGFHRFEQDVQDYNKAADSIMKEAGIRTIDLWQFTRIMGSDDELFCDHVHFEIWARQFQGAYIGGYVQAYLDNASKTSATT
ncbi:MAG: hypothetical protein JKX85_11525 [Phycisphaeraceae bacterium]|nr:hypothetical protein [Phycisphaeraceae bacterium]